MGPGWNSGQLRLMDFPSSATGAIIIGCHHTQSHCRSQQSVYTPQPERLQSSRMCKHTQSVYNTSVTPHRNPADIRIPGRARTVPSLSLHASHSDCPAPSLDTSHSAIFLVLEGPRPSLSRYLGLCRWLSSESLSLLTDSVTPAPEP